MSRFRLHVETPVTWVERMAEAPLALLCDHAHCELQAATAVQALIAKNPGRERLVVTLAAMASEEMEHFGRVTELLFARGGTLSAHSKSPYAERLFAAAKDGRGDAHLDRLLVSGLIEARSLERFRLLARHLDDPELAELYRSLMASEAGHQVLFHELALELAPAEVVTRRARELSAAEGAVIAELPFAYRMHSGIADLVPAQSRSNDASASAAASRTSGS